MTHTPSWGWAMGRSPRARPPWAPARSRDRGTSAYHTTLYSPCYRVLWGRNARCCSEEIGPTRRRDCGCAHRHAPGETRLPYVCVCEAPTLLSSSPCPRPLRGLPRCPAPQLHVAARRVSATRNGMSGQWARPFDSAGCARSTQPRRDHRSCRVVVVCEGSTRAASQRGSAALSTTAARRLLRIRRAGAVVRRGLHSVCSTRLEGGRYIHAENRSQQLSELDSAWAEQCAAARQPTVLPLCHCCSLLLVHVAASLATLQKAQRQRTAHNRMRATEGR